MGGAPPRRDAHAALGLSERERGVLRLRGRGASNNKEISIDLDLGEGTVKNHLTSSPRRPLARVDAEREVAVRDDGQAPRQQPGIEGRVRGTARLCTNSAGRELRRFIVADPADFARASFL